MALTYYKQSYGAVSVRGARFAAAGSAVEEHHLCFDAPSVGTFEEQLHALEQAHARAMSELGLGADTAVFRRVFLSDAANQQDRFEASTLGRSGAMAPIAISVIEQPPVGTNKLSLWDYHVRSQSPITKRARSNGVELERDGLVHLWTTGLVGAGSIGAYAQTESVLRDYERELQSLGATLRDHAVRTWFYVYDVDTEYAGLVEARKRHFESIGLTENTHYITSTGIAGRGASPVHRVALDAYAIRDIDQRRLRFLSAPEYLGPTHLYGVTFERGTRIAYGDRSHAFISGTASIDPEGRTLHVGDIERQCRRAFENVSALLADAGGSFADVAQLTVYVRDGADGPFVERFLEDQFPNLPSVIVRAPVCRPSWLVEIECIAVIPNDDPNLSEF
ncbi:MAG: Rid family hydrolase [Polyangiaceae bacterium]